jgi:hypothetical protein
VVFQKNKKRIEFAVVVFSKQQNRIDDAMVVFKTKKRSHLASITSSCYTVRVTGG